MQLPISLNDLSIQHAKLQDKLQQDFNKIFASSRYILGPYVHRLEETLKGFCQTADCISCANGTDALRLALQAVGVQPEDEVIVPSLTFIAPAQVIAGGLKAKPVFVDVDPNTYLLQADAVKAAMSKKTKAIIAVSLFGQVPDFDAINQIAKQQGVMVIEDAAQSFGAFYGSKPSCNLADFGCTSFYPSKPLGCYGDGGAVFTNNMETAQKLRSLRNYGMQAGVHETLGFNSRLDELQAAVLLNKMELFEAEVKLRTQKAATYKQLIQANIPPSLCQIPVLAKNSTSVYSQYIVQVPKRDAVVKSMHQDQVQVQVYYSTPCHLQPCFGKPEQALPHTEAVAKRILSLPFSPYIDTESQVYVIDCLKKALSKA